MSSKSLSVQVAIQAIVNLTQHSDLNDLETVRQQLRDVVYAIQTAVQSSNPQNLASDLAELTPLLPLILLKSVQLCQFEFVYREDELDQFQKLFNDIEQFATTLTCIGLQLCSRILSVVNAKTETKAEKENLEGVLSTYKKIFLTKPKSKRRKISESSSLSVNSLNSSDYDKKQGPIPLATGNACFLQNASNNLLIDELLFVFMVPNRF